MMVVIDIRRRSYRSISSMGEQPQTWHYGLMARWWAEFNTHAAVEVAYLQPLIERDGQPALDLACGTGRVMLPLLAAGLDVDGCDVSADMLALCAAKARQAGYAPNLYAQAMHALDVPRQYRTIFVCDSYGIGGQREHDAEVLRRCYQHLAPGGTLVINTYLPYGDARQWEYWLPGHHDKLPEPWPEQGTIQRTQSANGDEFEIQTRLADLDPVTQRLTRETRVSLWRDGKQVGYEEGTLLENMYFTHETLLMLSQAGFEDVSVRNAYTDDVATADQTMIMFVARKAG
jgi:SAM-dependent methyltransferase